MVQHPALYALRSAICSSLFHRTKASTIRARGREPPRRLHNSQFTARSHCLYAHLQTLSAAMICRSYLTTSSFFLKGLRTLSLVTNDSRSHAAGSGYASSMCEIMNSKLFDRDGVQLWRPLGVANISTACGEYAITLINTRDGTKRRHHNNL